ncbi:hypothetical protein [Kitasatospora sp. NPDC087314]|uniref:hypothetical protein n=1 Tax=Kitasatospora sp. NPDC087314 TaxID=3364068 RepID=UPI0038232BA5
MTDTTRPDPDPAAAPARLELASCGSRPAPADRDLGRPILDSPLVRGAMWLGWTGYDGIRTLHQGAGLARGWTERDVDGLDSWVALVDGGSSSAPARASPCGSPSCTPRHGRPARHCTPPSPSTPPAPTTPKTRTSPTTTRSTRCLATSPTGSAAARPG